MAKFIHIHVGDRVVRSIPMTRDTAPAPDPEFELRERWIEAFLTKLEELERAVTHDDAGGNQVGHPFYGNQYTDVAGGPKPTEAKTKSSVKAALHELLTSGHAFTLEELMAATGSKSKSNLTTAITHLKGANPHPLGVLNVLKNEKGEYHLDPAKPPSLDPYVAKPKAPKPAEPSALGEKPAPAATASAPAPAPSAGPSSQPVAKAPATPLPIEENDAQYAAALFAANEKVAQGFEEPPSKLDTKSIALQWKQDKAMAMAQWKANHTGKDQTPLPQEVFKEDIDLMEKLALAADTKDPAAAYKKAIDEWKNATQKAKSAAAIAAQTKAAEAASEALKAAKPQEPPKTGGTPLATPTGPGAFKAPDKIVPDDHKHIDEEDFKSGKYQAQITEVHNKLHKASSDAVSNKKQVQHALDERLKGSHHFQAMHEQHVKKGMSYYGSLSATLISQWASSSGDHNPVSVSAQLAVRDAFKMNPDSVETKALGALQGSDEDQVHKNAASQLGIDVSTPEKLASYKEGMKDFALAQYHETQEQFKKLGITELHLVRGMKIGSSGTGARKVNVKLQPASSFTTDHGIAKSFAGGHSLFAVKVPASQVLSSFITGYGCTNESEVVVLHHDSLEAVQVGAHHATTQGAMVSHISASGKLTGKASTSSAATKSAGAPALTVKGLPTKPSGAKNPTVAVAIQALKDGDVDAYISAVKAFGKQKETEKKTYPASTAWLKSAHQVAMAHPEFISAYQAKQGFKNIYV